MAHHRADAHADIHDIIARRWSPRSFDASQALEHQKLLSCLEAARWAPSCYGDEPWRFVVCDRFADEAGWQKLFSCLTPKNQRWAAKAPVLLLACAGATFRASGNPNRWAQYDTGAAVMSLSLQATAEGLASRQIGGFDADKARAAFAIPDDFTPMVAIALGYRAGIDTLDEDFHAPELDERKRRPLGDHCFAGTWNRPLA
jgi:nitroreductase